MRRITIEAGSHGEVITVSEMRKQLARILSPLSGDQEVFFTFTAHLEEYTSAPPEPPRIPLSVLHPVLGELARPEND